MSVDKREFWLILISFFLIYIVWGSTYLANSWGVKDVPPFIFAGARFLLAGILLFIMALFRGPISFTRKQLLNTIFAGFMLFAIGNGMVVWALKFIDSGVSALIVAFEPLLVVLLLWQMQSKRPSGDVILGVLLGMIGMALLVGQPDFNANPEWVKGALAILIGICAWAYISVWIPTADLPKSIITSSALQMFFGGVFLWIMSAGNGEFTSFNFDQLTQRSFWAFAYLLIFGSMLAFSAFNYLLKKVSPTKVVACTFVNPVVALILGWWLNHEHFSGQSIFAAVLLLTGVLFINGHARDIWRYFRSRRVASSG